MKSTLVLAMAFALASTSAAQPVTPHQAAVTKEFNSMDKNKDKSLSAEEMKGNKELSAQLKDLDKNKDSKLDETEFGKFTVLPVEKDVKE